MISKLLTQDQQTQIVELIKEQSIKFQKIEEQYEELYYEPYTQMRHKYSATSAIISGFAPERLNIEGITSTNLNYGLKDMLVQPELKCEMGIFHIYSNGSDLKGRTILERCKSLNENPDIPPVFFMIVVHMSRKGDISKIEICLPNKDGIVIKRDSIFACA